MLPILASSKFFAFRAEVNGKYLKSGYRKKAAGSHIEASGGTDEANARTRFLVQPSEEEEGLMHVQCCYNNKYWVPVQDSGSSRWIIRTADEPEEDLSSSSCTLFQAIPVKDKDNSIRFLHSGLQKIACVASIGDKTYLQLRDDGDNQTDNSENFTVVGLSRHKQLPKHVAFKGYNGKYLTGERSFLFFNGYLRFCSEDMRNANVIFTIFTNVDGTVRIKSNTGVDWRRGRGTTNDMISIGEPELLHYTWQFLFGQLVLGTTPECEPSLVFDNDPASFLFEVVTRDGFVALRNLGSNKFCRSVGPQDDLHACDDSISQWAKLKLEVPVVRREINDVKFHLDEARIYNKKILNGVSITRTNDTSRDLKATFSFTKKVEMVSTWETNVSSKIGDTTKMHFGATWPPFIVGGEVATSTESSTSAGQKTSGSNVDEVTITEEYSIPPRTTVAVKFLAMRASCDVPYSYKQTDVLTSGEEVTTNYDDGIYTVANNYNFHIIVTDDKEEIKKLVG